MAFFHFKTNTLSYPESPWQTIHEQTLLHWTHPSQPSTPKLRSASAPNPNTSWQTLPSALNGHTCHHGYTEPSPRTRTCLPAPGFFEWRPRLSPEALLHLMRAGRTKKGVEKRRKGTVHVGKGRCKWGSYSLHLMYLLSSLTVAALQLYWIKSGLSVCKTILQDNIS